MNGDGDVIIVGGGPGGVTLALALQEAGIPARVYEAAPEFRPVGLGINLLPHASRVHCELGLENELAKLAVTTRESVFYNRFGQLIYAEAAGRHGGYRYPQFSIHRADLQKVLVDAFKQRAGANRMFAGWKCCRVEQDESGVTVHFRDGSTGEQLPPQRGAAAIACDGLHSVIRKQLHPTEGAPIYSGVNMWRGVTRWSPILSGASMVRAGWLTNGKLVIYPIRDNIDENGLQLMNWVVEIETPKHLERDWNRASSIDDFIGSFADWHFDWLDVPAMLRSSDMVLEFPMIDQNPLPWWSQGRITLLGDAAHPMYPRGSNGAAQAILDAESLAECLASQGDIVKALKAYEEIRLPFTANVVTTNRKNPPDAILREVFLRTGDKPFKQIDDVITQDELRAISDRYKQVSGVSVSPNRSDFHET
ncbi:MAG: flavin-dependent oxidoreductase [Dongiaceae bacterium]